MNIHVSTKGNKVITWITDGPTLVTYFVVEKQTAEDMPGFAHYKASIHQHVEDLEVRIT